jgi:hypothetical protein
MKGTAASASMYPFFGVSRPSKNLSEFAFSAGVMSHCGAGGAPKGVCWLNCPPPELQQVGEEYLAEVLCQ